MKNIIIKGARTHNLKNIGINVPRNKITVFVGVSGSGKSTIAYDIIAAEGQRQFLESISTFAARLLKRTVKAEIDSIDNLSPTISISQSNLVGGARSTVGTSTEIYTYLRLLFSRFGSERNLSAGHFSFNNPKGACKHCNGLGVEYMINPRDILDYNKSLDQGACQLSIYKPGSRLYNIISTSGKLDMGKPIKAYSKEELDFLLYSPKIILSNKDQGFVQTFSHQGIINKLIERATDPRGISKNKSIREKKYWIEQTCTVCHGGRLNQKALKSTINEKNIGDYANMQLYELLNGIKKYKKQEAQELIQRIALNIQHLIDVDLGYLSLNRGLNTLSGGEAQRLKLARELGSDLIEMIYILDEPSTGLHPKDRQNLVDILYKLKSADNTIIVVEHDKSIMQEADYIIEVGPGAGKQGGTITFEGTYNELQSSNTITAKYISKNTSLKKQVRIPINFLEIHNATIHNLKSVDVKIPLEVFCAVTGVSGSGKSSLVVDELRKQHLDGNIVFINQKAMRGMARGNIATYTGIFDDIRTLFAKSNNVSKSLFSSNSEGACPDCKGLGYIKTDMHFMGDVKTICETCNGQKYKKEILQYKYNNKNVNDVLNMTVSEANSFFNQENIRKKLQTLMNVGLGYLTLGQTHDTFSGGEAQRLKLAEKLNKRGEIFILDEPTSGLHLADIEKLLELLNHIIDNGNSVITISHNIDLVKQSDWIIDMGPTGGDKGGYVIAEGTPTDISRNPRSVTGKYLKPISYNI